MELCFRIKGFTALWDSHMIQPQHAQLTAFTRFPAGMTNDCVLPAVPLQAGIEQTVKSFLMASMFHLMKWLDTV